MTTTPGHVAVLGTGLIGTSIGLGLRQAGWATSGWDPDAAVVSEVVALGSFDEMAPGPDDAIRNADLVVIAAPAGAAAGVLAGIETNALVTDVTGIKGPVTSAGRHLPRYVSSHPMAGREVSGPAAASAGLFRGAAWVVVTDGAAERDITELEAIVDELGASPIRMTAAEHDDAVAMISHLPQVLASALVREATQHPAALNLASGSFRDLTRVAASDPALWADLLTANGQPLAAVIEVFVRRLSSWAEAIRSGDTAAITDALADASETRRAMAPPVVGVGVALADRPGELARVGRALEASKVDVRDLQLRHATYGGGGILTLSVRPGEAETLRAALLSQGLLLE